MSRISFPISFKLCQPSLNHGGLMPLADCSGPHEQLQGNHIGYITPSMETSSGKCMEETREDYYEYCSACIRIRKGVVNSFFLHGHILFLAIACAMSPTLASLMHNQPFLIGCDDFWIKVHERRMRSVKIIGSRTASDV